LQSHVFALTRFPSVKSHGTALEKYVYLLNHSETRDKFWFSVKKSNDSFQKLHLTISGSYIPLRPLHKKVCKETTENTPKLLNSFIANPLLSHMLQMAFVCEFKLHEKPIIDKPFIARCDVSIEPSDIAISLRLMMGQIARKDITSLEGMLHIKNFIPLDASHAVDATRLELWRSTKKGNAERGFLNAPVGLIDFHTNNTEQSVTFGMVIQNPAIARIKAGVGFETESAFLPGKMTIPVSRDACLEYVALFHVSRVNVLISVLLDSFINSHIRADKRNQLRLRTQISKEEIDKIVNDSEQ
jgi:hypothetical protein